jgi:hypothetical protein
MGQKQLQRDMVNRDFEPNDNQERLLDVLLSGRDSGKPWGWATVKRFEEETDLRKQYVSRELEGLLGAGWVEKPYRGLYRFVADCRDGPREVNDE